jgi:uncharacterized membrane protein YesL
MSNNRQFGDGIMFTISNYIWWYFSSNFYFVLLNLPLVLLMVGLNTGVIINPNLWCVVLCCIPIGPSLTALLFVAGKLIREGDINLTRDFFKAYKNSFRQSIFFWSLQILVITILYIDKRFFFIRQNKIAYLFQFFIFCIVLLGIYALSIISRFYLKTIDVLKLSITALIVYFKTSFFNLFIIIASAYIFYRQPIFCSIFLINLFCYSLMHSNKKVLEDIERKIQPTE